MNDRELATVLASLRFMQAYELGGDVEQVDLREYFTDHLVLDVNEIDELCERLNTEVTE